MKPPPTQTVPPKPASLSEQVGGAHYKADKIQHVEFCEQNVLPWCISCALKYVVRHHRKNGAEDLKKAEHYLRMGKEQLELRNELLRAAGRSGEEWDWPIDPEDFIGQNNIRDAEAFIIRELMRIFDQGTVARQLDIYEVARRAVEGLLEECYTS